MAITVTIPVQDSLVEALQTFGDLEMAAKAALRRYALDLCLQRIERAERKIAAYEQRYGSDYATFNQRICTDERFLEAINRAHPTWEADAIEWNYRVEEAQEWRE